MKILNALLLVIFTFGCSNSTEYTGDSTNVVITKNPKGNGEETSTKQLKLAAPWLDDSTELELEPTTIAGYDGTKLREVLGTFETGTTLKIARNKPVIIQFEVRKSAEVSLEAIQIEISKVALKNSTRTVGQISGEKILKLTINKLTELTSFEYFIAPARSIGEGQCDLRSILTKTQVLSGSSVKCGSNSDVPVSDDDDDDEDDDDDDDDDRRN